MIVGAGRNVDALTEFREVAFCRRRPCVPVHALSRHKRAPLPITIRQLLGLGPVHVIPAHIFKHGKRNHRNNFILRGWDAGHELVPHYPSLPVRCSPRVAFELDAVEGPTAEVDPGLRSDVVCNDLRNCVLVDR
jgi:hypothetical protein